MKKLINTLKFVLFVLLFVVTTIIHTSCESRSGKLNKEIPVKVIVLSEGKVFQGLQVIYKVRVIDKQVVAYAASYNSYNINDTIMVKPSLIKY